MSARHDAIREQPGRERLFVSTSPGLEPALLDELREWVRSARGVRGGAEVEAPPGMHQTLNLHSRTATRVLLRVASFEAADFRALEMGLARVRLEPFRGPGRIRIQAVAHRSRLSHSGRLRDTAAKAWKVPVDVAS